MRTPTPNPESPKNEIHFGLRQHLLDAAGATVTSATGSPAELRKSPIALGASVALVNVLMGTTPGAAQSPVEFPEVLVRGQQDASPNVTKSSSPKYTAPLRDVPQTITVVPQKVMQEQGATTLRDVLKNVPGISIQAGEGGVPAGDNLSIRGFNARTDLFIDGVRDIGGYSRDSFNFEQVEVVKGPASAYSGRGSTGGSINIETKKPQQKAFYRGEVGFGTDNYKRFTLDLNQPVSLWSKSSAGASPSGKGVVQPGAPEPTIGFRLNAMWTEADVPNRNEVGGRKWGIAPSLAFGLGTPTTFTFTYMHLDQDNVPDYGIPWVTPTSRVLSRFRDQAAPVDYSNFYGILARDYEKITTDIATFEMKHAFNDNNSLRYLVRYGRNKRDSMITAPRFLTDNSTDLRRQLQSRDQEDTILANLLDYTAQFSTWGVKHNLVAGLEYDRESQENFLRAGPDPAPANLYFPNPNVPYTGVVARTGAKDEIDTETASLYLFDTLKFGEHWQLSGGVRYDYYSAKLDQRSVTGNVTQLDRIDRMASWRTALAYKPAESGTIYVAAGTSFNPSAEGLTSGFNAAASVLKPEKSLTYEIGTKWEFFDKRFSVSAAAFRTEKENARTQGVIAGDVLVLDGEQVVQGFELGVSGNITKEWALFGGYTFLDSEIKSSRNPAEVGRELPNTPPHSFSLWTTYQLPWKIEVGAGAQYVGTRFANTTNTREAADYWTFDAMVKYKVTDHMDIRLNVYNLADEKYIDRLSGGHFVPGPGRSATVTASFRF